MDREAIYTAYVTRMTKLCLPAADYDTYFKVTNSVREDDMQDRQHKRSGRDAFVSVESLFDTARLLTCIFILLCCVSGFSQVPVSAQLVDGTGSVATQGFLHFQLENCGNNFPAVAAQPGISQQAWTVVKTEFDLTPNQADGSILGQVLANNEILCGNVASTYYLITAMKDADTPLGPVSGEPYVICDSSAPMGTPCSNPGGETWSPTLSQPAFQPVKPGFVQIYGNPTTSQTWNQPTNTTGFFYGHFDFTNATETGLTPYGSLVPLFSNPSSNQIWTQPGATSAQFFGTFDFTHALVEGIAPANTCGGSCPWYDITANVTCNGTDNSAILQANLNAAAGGVAFMPPLKGNCGTAVPLILPQYTNLYISNGTALQATAVMSGHAVLETDPTLRASNQEIWGGGTIDGNGKADHVIWIRNFAGMRVHDLVLKGSNLTGLLSGDGSASYSDNLWAHHLWIDRPGAVSIPSGSIGIHTQNNGDNFIHHNTIISFDRGVEVDSSNNSLESNHVWARLPFTEAFVDNGTGNQWINDYGDGPATYCWREGLSATNFLISGGRCYNGSTSVDNVLVSVYVGSTTPAGNIRNLFSYGYSSGHRIAQDLLVVNSPSTISLSGNQDSNVVTKLALGTTSSSISTPLLNGICMVDGVNVTTLASAVTCAGSSGVIDIQMVSVPALTGNVTIPSGVTLKFEGPNCITTTGFTLTINGPLVAPPVRIFCGSGAVDGLTTVRPEWFGSTAINTAVQSAFAAGGGTLLLQANTTYQSSFNSSCWTLSNVNFQGGGEPVPNSLTAPTALTGGTIIQNGMCFSGTNGIRVTDLGVDNGSAIGTSTNDGLAFCGTTCSSSGDAFITGIYVQNVIALESAGSVAYHAIRVEHADGPILRNLTAWYGTHGLALKSTNAILTGLKSYGNSSEGLTIKADNYTGTGNVVASDIIVQTPNASNIQHDGVVLDAEQAGVLSNVTVSNIQVYNAQGGLSFLSNGTAGSGAINGVSINDFFYLYGNGSLGLSNTNCVLSSGAGGQIVTWAHINHVTCINGPGAAHYPFALTMLMTNSTIADVQTVGSNSTGSTLEGNGLKINGWTETNATDSRPFYVTGNSSVTVNGYQGASLISSSVVDAGSTLYYSTDLGNSTGYAIRTPATTPFAVQNGAGTLNYFFVDNNGNAAPNSHLNQTGANHFAGSGASPLTVSFPSAFSSTPACTVMDVSGTPAIVAMSAFSSTGFTATGSAGHTLDWICIGNPN